MQPKTTPAYTGSKLDFNKFLREMNNTDQDFAGIEVGEIVKLLNEHKTITLPTGADSFFVNALLDKLDTKNEILIQELFPCLLLLIQYYKIEMLDDIITKMIMQSRSNASGFRPQILSNIREAINNHANYDEARCSAIFTCLYQKMKTDLFIQVNDDLKFVIEILIAIYENLGYMTTPADNKDLLDKIFKFLEPNAPQSMRNVFSLIVNLTKVLCRYIDDDSTNQLIKFLSTPELASTPIPFAVYSAIVTAHPKKFGKHIDTVVPIFLKTINGIDLSEPELSEHDISIVSDGILACAAVLKKFPQSVEKYVNDFLSAITNFIGYGVEEIVDEEANEEEEDEEDDDGFEIDEEVEVEVDQEFGNFGNNTWKIRKASMRLLSDLLATYRGQVLGWIKENFSLVTSVIKDSDIGARHDAIVLTQTLIHTYRSDLPQEVVDEWVGALCGQVDASEVQIIGTVLEAIRKVTHILGTISEDDALAALGQLNGTLQDGFAQSGIELALLLTKAIPESEAVLETAAEIIRNGLELNTTNKILAIEYAAELYTLAQGPDEYVDSLNSAIIAAGEDATEMMIASMPTLATYLIKFPGEESAQASLDSIVGALGKPMARRSVTGAIALLAASEQASVLKPHVKAVTECIVRCLKGNDSAVQFRGLWCVRLLLRAGIINTADVIALIDPVLEIIGGGDASSRLLAVSFLNEAKVSGEIGKAGQKIIEMLDSPASDALIAAAAAFVRANADDAFIESLVARGEKQVKIADRGEASAAGMAAVIGAACAGTPLQKALEGGLGKTRFTTMVAGELGCWTDLSSNTALFDKLFKDVAAEGDRVVSVTAAEALGHASVGSATIRARLLEAAKKDNSLISVWLAALLALARRAAGHLTMKELAPVADFLFEERGGKNAARATAEVLALLAGVEEAFVDRLFQVGTPTAVLGVSIYAYNRPEETGKLIERAARAIDANRPEVTQHALAILMYSLKAGHLVEVTAHAASITKCAIFSDAQLVEETFGFVKQKVDVGSGMRSTALDIALAIADEAPGTALEAAIAALNDPAPAVEVRALDVVAKIGRTAAGRQLLADAVERLTTGLEAVEKALNNTSEPAPELDVPLQTVLGILNGTPGAVSPVLRELIDRHRGEAFGRVQLSKAAAATARTVAKRSVYFTLMESLCAEASGVFTE